ncbi:MAG: UvrD-helicase domain-containing protein, partial [Acidobacteria bacterium]|nr:UvrD-helicase domain-containing protein [Acidobacteriota bacterium]
MNDLEARQAIRGSLDETLVVEAAAGTGKTTELVRRLVAVLASGRGRVEGLVAVTFTEKAAGELKLRLRAALEDARHEQPAGSLERLRLEDALSRLEEARLSTLHGFCGDLLRERPVEAGVDPLFSVLTEDESERLFDAAFRTFFEDQLADLPEGLRRALCRRSRGMGAEGEESPVGRLRYAAYQLAGWRDLSAPYLRKPFPREETIDALVESVLSLADDSARGADLKDPLFLSTARLRRFAADLRKAERDRPRDHDGLEAALVELSHERDLKDKRKGRGTNYGDGLTREEIRTRRDALVESLGTFQKIADADLAACLKNELEGCLTLYEKSKAARGALDFLDLLLSARDLLRRDESVRRDFGGRFTHVFVDEFQDTDPLQAEILLLLASDDPAVSDFRAVRPVPGKLFVVGDPKQAIYRFRRADPGTYREVKELLAARGARVVALTTSFRSVPSLQRVINAAFAPLMTGDVEADQPDYLALAPARAEPATSQPSVIALPVPKPFGWGEQVRPKAIDECLPDVTGAFVKWLVESSGFTVEENGSRVPVAPRHVCLLFRRYTSFGRDVTRPSVEALEARGVPHVLVGGRSYHAREEILALRNALTALEWPDDELAVYATLKGPLFALADEDLFLWKEAVRRLHPVRVPNPAPEGLEEVGKALGLLAALSRERNARPVSETIARLLAETRAHAGLIFLPAGEQALANVLHLAELARQYEASGGL